MTSSKKLRGRRKKANRPGGVPMRFAPSTLSENAHPFFEPTFVPIRLTDLLRDHKGVKIMQLGLADGMLESWQLGRKGTHICSKFVTREGTEDCLTSPDPDDEDYGSLVDAHVQRLAQIMGLLPTPKGM